MSEGALELVDDFGSVSTCAGTKGDSLQGAVAVFVMVSTLSTVGRLGFGLRGGLPLGRFTTAGAGFMESARGVSFASLGTLGEPEYETPLALGA